MMGVLLFIAALMIKVDATSDDEDDQEIFGALLVAILFAGPVSFCTSNGKEGLLMDVTLFR